MFAHDYASAVDCNASSLVPAGEAAVVVASIAGLEPVGGSAFAISRNLVLTAYHNVRGCTVSARKDDQTDSRLELDGSHTASRFPLGCAGLALSFPTLNSTATSCSAERIVSGAHLVRAPRDQNDEGIRMDGLQPSDDWVVLRLNTAAPAWLRLSQEPPRIGEPVWMLGIPAGLTPESAGNPDSKLAGWSAALNLMIRAMLYDVLAVAVENRSEAPVAAKKALESCDSETKPEDRAIVEEAAKEELAELRAIARNEGAVEASITKWLTRAANTAEGASTATNAPKESVERERMRASELRRVARAPSERASEARDALLALRDEERTAAEDIYREVESEFSDSRGWMCERLSSRGTVSSVQDDMFTIVGYAGPGMSGGPVLNGRGEVIGMLSRLERGVGWSITDGVIAVRADRIGPAIERVVKDDVPLTGTR